jgi:hypothetical protein
MPRLAEAPLEELFVRAVDAYGQAIAQNGELRRELSFAGRQLSFRFAGPALAPALLGAMVPRIVEDGGGDLGIGLWADADPGPWHPGDLGPRGLVRGSSPDGVSAVYESGSGALTLFDRVGSRILHHVPGVDEIPWWERAAPLRPALFFALASTSRHLVHAGAVGDPGLGCVLLAGPGGAGKTSLALAAVEHGLRYVGDDYVLLEDGIAWNLYATAKVDAGPGREKTVVEVDPQSLVEALPVQAVVVPAIGAGRVRVQEISAGQALLALAPSTAFQMPFDRGAVLATLGELVRRVPCHRLDLGRSAEAAASALTEVLAGG